MFRAMPQILEFLSVNDIGEFYCTMPAIADGQVLACSVLCACYKWCKNFTSTQELDP